MRVWSSTNKEKKRFLIYESLTKILGFYINKITGTAASDNEKIS